MAADRDGTRLTLAYLGDPNEVHTRRWLSFFARRGHRVVLLVAAEGQLETPLPEGIELRRLEPFAIRWFRPWSFLAARRSLRRALAAVGADVLHAHYLTGYGFLAWLSGFRPYAITVWGSDVFRTLPESRRARVYGWLALRGAALVTADSADLAAAAVRGGARPRRTFVVQFGVDTERFAPAPADPALRSSFGGGTGPVVFSPRILFPWNRHDLVVGAVSELAPDVRLVFSALHADPAYRAGLVAEVERRGLAARTVFLEEIPHDRMADHLRASDVVVSIPETDGTPVTILESLACEVPVVASAVPSVVEWLGRIEGSPIAPIGDQAATTEAIRAVLGWSAEERAHVTARGRDLVVAEGDQRTNMERVERWYHRLAARRPGRAADGRAAAAR
jgi:glycosyltransferase involved in cell wall biosynthesis